MIEYIELTVKLQVNGKAENRQFVVASVVDAIERQAHELSLTDDADPEKPKVIAFTVIDNKTGYHQGKAVS